MKLPHLFKINLLFCFSLIIFTISNVPINNINAQETNQTQNEKPLPINVGTPQGESKPGATRPEAMCENRNPTLTAIVANKGEDFTVSEYPTFWFYIPYSSEEIRELEFALKNKEKTKTIYRTVIEVTQTPGLIKVTIPPQPENALKTLELYYWDLKLYCTNNPGDEVDLLLNGWIQRLPLNPELQTQLQESDGNAYQVYLDNKLWYDGISSLAQAYLANPDNPAINSAWTELLQTINLSELDTELLVESNLTTNSD